MNTGGYAPCARLRSKPICDRYFFRHQQEKEDYILCGMPSRTFGTARASGSPFFSAPSFLLALRFVEETAAHGSTREESQ